MNQTTYVMQANYDNNNDVWIDVESSKCKTVKDFKRIRHYYKDADKLKIKYRAIKRTLKEVILK